MVVIESETKRYIGERNGFEGPYKILGQRLRYHREARGIHKHYLFTYASAKTEADVLHLLIHSYHDTDERIENLRDPFITTQHQVPPTLSTISHQLFYSLPAHQTTMIVTSHTNRVVK
jgi:hypothetical protein